MDATSSLLAIANATGRRAGSYAAWAELEDGKWVDSPAESLLVLRPVTAGEVERAAYAGKALPLGLALLSPLGTIRPPRAVVTPYVFGEQYAVYSIEDQAFATDDIPVARFLRALEPAPPDTANHGHPVTNLNALAKATGSVLVLVERQPWPPQAPRLKIPFDSTAHAARGPQRLVAAMGEPIAEEAGPYDPRTIWQKYQPYLVGAITGTIGFAFGMGLTRRLK